MTQSCGGGDLKNLAGVRRKIANTNSRQPQRRAAGAIASVLVLAAALCAPPAAAATFNEFVGFGDSEIDSGWWKGALNGQCGAVTAPCTTGDATADFKIQSAINNGGTGAPVGVGVMNSQILASYYGVSALPANHTGGTNYAIPGTLTTNASGSGNANPNPNLPSTVQQMTTYLLQNGNTANPNGLYLVSSGGNDVTYVNNPANAALYPTDAAKQAFLASQAAALTASIKSLKTDGASTIVVYGLKGSGALAVFYTQTLFSDLAAANVDFIAADIRGLLQTVQANPAAYNLLTVDPGIAGDSNTPSACVAGAGATGWGQRCANSLDPSPDHAHLRDATAETTSLFSDDQHFSAAGQLIEANYVHGLIEQTVPNATPLPSALPLFATGLGVVSFLGWRRKRKAAAA